MTTLAATVPPAVVDRAFGLVRGALLGVALFAVAAHALLLDGWSVPSWLLPVCGLGAATIGAVAARGATFTTHPAPRWLLGLALFAPLLVTVVLTWSALATPSRDWDGIVAWGIKANALAAAPTLQQPLFAWAAVFHHSPDYPLLQPLAIASIGGIALPLQYVLLVALVLCAIWRRTGDAALACWAGLGIALLPELITGGGGAVDSGYAETLHALVLAAVAAALLLDDVLLLVAAVVLLPFAKPEGTVHLVLLMVATTAFGPVRQCAAAVGAGAAALCVWLPLQLRLAHGGPSSPLLAPVLAAAAMLLIAARAALRGRSLRPRTAGVVGGSVVAAAATALVLAQPLFAGSRTVLWGHYLGDLDRLVHKLPALASILVELAATALSPRRFGATFAILLLMPLLCRRAGAVPLARSAVVFYWLCGIAVVAAFLLSPEADVAHHLQSSASRLLLQLAGAGWLLATVALAPHWREASAPLWLRRVLGQQPR